MTRLALIGQLIHCLIVLRKPPRKGFGMRLSHLRLALDVDAEASGSLKDTFWRPAELFDDIIEAINFSHFD